jgi:hypothetical protein
MGAGGTGGYVFDNRNADGFRWLFTGSEQMRLTSTGLGIGESSPIQKLDVRAAAAGIYLSSTTGTNQVALQTNNSGGNFYFGIDNSAGNNFNTGTAYAGVLWRSGANPICFVNNNTERARITSGGLFAFADTNADKIQFNGTVSNAYLISKLAGGGSLGDGELRFTAGAVTAGTFTFSSAGTERARITSGGNLLVGTTGTDPLGGRYNGVVLGSGGSIDIRHATNTSDWGISASSGTIVNFYSDNGSAAVFAGSISVNGSATAYNTSSDYRLKNITGPITTSGTYIDSLKPVEGTWKADGSTFVGLIAHEVQEASRTTVATGTKDGEQMQGMDYSSAEIIANLIAEIQSLRARVAALESN